MAHYLIEAIAGSKSLHDYGLPPQTWRRACRLIGRYGPDGALERLDARAERAAQRGNFSTAARWRDIMAAIHAISNDEPLPCDSYH